jgi:hypothetical protein
MDTVNRKNEKQLNAEMRVTAGYEQSWKGSKSVILHFGSRNNAFAIKISKEKRPATPGKVIRDFNVPINSMTA